MIFPCTECGICCKNISTIQELKEFDVGNGICKYLDLNTNLCNIYDTRPDICRIDKMYEIEYYKYFSKEEFYIKNAEICNELQIKFNIDTSFRIKIKE